MNRQAMLSLTASVALCEAPETRCELSINRQLWQESDTANRQVLNGDFVHLRIEAASPSQELHMALCEQESADAQRYVFGRSPSRSPTPSDPAYHDEEGLPSEEEAASPSLLQLHAMPTMRHHSHSNDLPPENEGSSVNERPKMSIEPHVGDLWCAPSTSSVPHRPDDTHSVGQRSKSNILTLEDKVSPPSHYVHIQCHDAYRAWQQLFSLHLPPFLDELCTNDWHAATGTALNNTTLGGRPSSRTSFLHGWIQQV